MAMDLAALEQLINSQAGAQSQISGLESSISQAQALRGGGLTGQAQTGYVDPFSAMASMIEGSRARKTIREKTPQLEAAQQAIAKGKSAQEMYGLQKALEKEKVRVSEKEAIENTRVSERAEDMAIKAGEQERIQLINPETGFEEAVQIRNGVVYQNGKRVENQEGWLKSMKSNKPMSSASLSTHLERLGKRIKPIEQAQQKLAVLDEMLRPYAKGGTKAGESVPGMGFFEGSRSAIGDAFRMAFAGQEGQDINAQFQSFVNVTLNELAGSAQTSSEVKNILRGLGAQTFNTEESVLAALGRVKVALRQEAIRIRNTTPKEIKGIYEENYGGAEFAPYNLEFEHLDFGLGGEEAPGPDTPDTPDKVKVEKPTWAKGLSIQQMKDMLK